MEKGQGSCEEGLRVEKGQSMSLKNPPWFGSL
jgi:hypothetical protein